MCHPDLIFCVLISWPFDLFHSIYLLFQGLGFWDSPDVYINFIFLLDFETSIYNGNEIRALLNLVFVQEMIYVIICQVRRLVY